MKKKKRIIRKIDFFKNIKVESSDTISVLSKKEVQPIRQLANYCLCKYPEEGKRYKVSFNENQMIVTVTAKPI